MRQSNGDVEMPADSEDERAALEAFVVENSDLERLEALLDQFNVFEAIGAVRQELRHSDFLAFLLNPQQPHGLSDTFLRRFLQRTLRNGKPNGKTHEATTSSASAVSPIDLDIWSLDETLVLREWRDIDILALDEAHNLAVVIENKIGTHEHSQQLQRYYAAVQAHYPDWQIIAIYLTPEGELPSDPRYTSVDYTLICEVLEQLTSSRASTLGADVLSAINHYTRMLRRHIVGESELTELCRRIYLKHQRALDLIYEYRPDRQAELFELLTQFIKAEAVLVSDYSSKSYVRFVPKRWDESAPLRSGKGWTRSGRLLLFEFHYRGNDLRLKLTIGPGPREIRQRLLTLALTHRPPFTVTDATLYEKWNMIYDRPMVKDALSLDKSLDEVEEHLRKRWAEFLEHDLQAIEAEMRAQEELWQELDAKL